MFSYFQYNLWYQFPNVIIDKTNSFFFNVWRVVMLCKYQGIKNNVKYN
jgi:hypothetical protein